MLLLRLCLLLREKTCSTEENFPGNQRKETDFGKAGMSV